MSLIDVDKDKLRKATFLFARKKTGSIVSSMKHMRIKYHIIIEIF